jgi:dihydrolipoamide dehydrogenase
MELAAAVSRMPGVDLAGPLDTAAVTARRDKFVGHYQDDAQVRRVEKLPATVVRGQGRLAGSRTVQVTAPDSETKMVEARHAVVLATGSAPLIPDIPGLRDAKPWTNREATSVKEVPRRLLVMGGGPVGCEMAQALRALGSDEVTVVELEDRLLVRHEPFASELLVQSFQESGITVCLGRSTTRVERALAGGSVQVYLDDGSHLEADEILVGAGRRANVDDLGLETVGVGADGPLEVDATMRVKDVADGWLYAVGDVNGRNLLTHMGKYQARICGDAITARAKGLRDDAPGGRDIADDVGAPQAIFTDPEIITVGRVEAKAIADGFRVRTVEIDISEVIGADLQADRYSGRAKIVVDEDRKVLLGATFVGPGVVDHLHAATIAVTAQVPLDQLWHAVPAFPTTSEMWLQLLEAYGL